MNGWEGTIVALAAIAYAGYDRWLLHVLIRDGKIKTAPTPRKPDDAAR